MINDYQVPGTLYTYSLPTRYLVGTRAITRGGSRRFPFVSLVAFFAIVIFFRFSAFLGGFCSFGISLALHPPRALCYPEVCVYPVLAVFLRSWWFFLFFFSSFAFFDFDLYIVCFILSFTCGYYKYAVSVSASAATRLAYVPWYEYIPRTNNK